MNVCRKISFNFNTGWKRQSLMNDGIQEMNWLASCYFKTVLTWTRCFKRDEWDKKNPWTNKEWIIYRTVCYFILLPVPPKNIFPMSHLFMVNLPHCLFINFYTLNFICSKCGYLRNLIYYGCIMYEVHYVLLHAININPIVYRRPV